MSDDFCRTCGAPSAWVYAPSDKEAGYCDAHVPRGCSCNATFNEASGDWDGPQELAEDGRLLPCCEYWPHDPTTVLK